MTREPPPPARKLLEAGSPPQEDAEHQPIKQHSEEPT